MGMIKDADMFQLFWSTNSMYSHFVRQEYQYALSLHRAYFVLPVYWEIPFPEKPEENLPPEELRRLHFENLAESTTAFHPPTLQPLFARREPAKTTALEDTADLVSEEPLASTGPITLELPPPELMPSHEPTGESFGGPQESIGKGSGTQWLCHNCGTVVRKGARYCSRCGADLGASSSETSHRVTQSGERRMPVESLAPSRDYPTLECAAPASVETAEQGREYPTFAPGISQRSRRRVSLPIVGIAAAVLSFLISIPVVFFTISAAGTSGQNGAGALLLLILFLLVFAALFLGGIVIFFIRRR